MQYGPLGRERDHAPDRDADIPADRYHSGTSFDYASIGGWTWAQIAYLGVITSVVSYLLWYYALWEGGSGEGSPVCHLQPILTTVLAVVLLGQGVHGAVSCSAGYWRSWV